MYTAVAGKYPIEPRSQHVHRGSGAFSNPIMDAKQFKVLGHRYYEGSDVLIWHDANIVPKLSLQENVDKYLGDADVCFLKSPYRDCIYKEFAYLKVDPRFKRIHERLAQQEQHYRSKGYPESNGLCECGFFIRRTTENVNAFFEKWWIELCMWTYRDQVSMPYVLWANPRLGLNVRIIDLGNVRDHRDFLYFDHYAR